jgi:hypothetical protein
MIRGYTFQLIDGVQIDIGGIRCSSLAEAMNHAVKLAFRHGDNKTAEQVRGEFIRVKDPNDNEVFRTPVPRGR